MIYLLYHKRNSANFLTLQLVEKNLSYLQMTIILDSLKPNDLELTSLRVFEKLLCGYHLRIFTRNQLLVRRPVVC